MHLTEVAVEDVGRHLVLRLTAPGWQHQIVLPLAASEVESWLRELGQRRTVLLALRYLGAAPGAVLGLEIDLGLISHLNEGEGMAAERGGYLSMVAGLASLMDGRWRLRDAVADGHAPRESFSPLLPHDLEPSRSTFAGLLNEVAMRP
ncbi:hypothetical protein [Roseateles sp. BYS96W]|uniref:Uncharacterized protein n=1 Tax=Pelomonas nitida TaxID=3299027 RepID=A0ABW7G910_9BURK